MIQIEYCYIYLILGAVSEVIFFSIAIYPESTSGLIYIISSTGTQISERYLFLEISHNYSNIDNNALF